MIKPGHSKTLSKPASDSDETKMHIASEELQQVAYTIEKQLEDLLLIASENQMDMLIYLIEMAMLEAASTVKNNTIVNQA